jgi:hypothetical protein
VKLVLSKASIIICRRKRRKTTDKFSLNGLSFFSGVILALSVHILRFGPEVHFAFFPRNLLGVVDVHSLHWL